MQYQRTRRLKMFNKVATKLILFVVLFTSIANAQTKRIMLLGDSITRGVKGSAPVGGFRDDLYTLLTNAGIDFNFVGGEQDGNATNFDVDHEGHGGWRADEIDAIVNSKLSTYLPKLVALHIGTNDISQGQPNSGTNGTINEIESIVDKINAFDSDIAIVLSSLIPRDDNKDATTDNLNSLIEDLFFQKQAEGYNIFYAGNSEVFKTNPNFANDYLDDDVHPNNTGYTLFSEVYGHAILNICNEVRTLAEYFSDNFNRANLRETWHTDNGYVIANNRLSNSNPPDGWDLAIFRGHENPSRVSFSWGTNADSVGIQEGGLALKLDNANDILTVKGYLLWIGSNNRVRLFKIENGEPGELIEQKDSNLAFPSAGDRFEVRMSSDETSNHFDVYNNGTLNVRLSHSDKTFITAQRQYSGVMLRNGINNDLDDFEIFKQSDTTPPATIADLQQVEIFPSSVLVQWTAPGDDGNVGLASIYELRFSTSTITEANFSAASLVATNAPRPAGNVEQYNIAGLAQNTTYHIAVKTFDDGGNSSLISNNLVVTTSEGQEIVDDFNRGALGVDWTAHPDIAIVNDELSNSSAVENWQDGQGNGFLAIYTARLNPIQVSFAYGTAATGADIENTAMAVMLDKSTIDANGYMIWYRPSQDKIYCFQLVNGLPGPLVGTGPVVLPHPNAGSVFKVVISNDATGNHFEVFINGTSYGTITDATLHVNPNTQDVYSGVLLHGNRNNEVDNFTFLGQIGNPDKIVVISGNFQEGNVGEDLPIPFVARVTDENGFPIFDVDVDAVVVEGNGVLDKSGADGNIRLEAEGGGLTPPMTIVKDNTVSGDHYVHSGTVTHHDGRIDLSFNIVNSGTYNIWGRVYAANGDENSYWVLMDDDPDTATWDIDQFQQWIWIKISDRNNGVVNYNLDAGPHVLHILGREELTRIDKLVITSDFGFVPSGLEPSGNYQTDLNGEISATFSLGTLAGTNRVQMTTPLLPGKKAEFTATGFPGPVMTLSIFSGNNQFGDANQPLGAPFIVKAVDIYGNPVQGVPITYQVIEGNGNMIESQPLLTDEGGFTSSTLILGDLGPINRVQASTSGGSQPIIFTATAQSGVATNIELFSGSGQSGTVGDTLALPIVAKVTDSENTPQAGVGVTFTTNQGSGSIVENQPVLTDSNGLAQANWILGNQAGAQQAQAIALGLIGSPVTFVANGTADVAAILQKVSGDSSSGKVSKDLVEPFVVEVTDQYGNTLPGVSVLFTVLEGGGQFSNSQQAITVNTGGDGRASVILTLGPLAGTFNNKVQAEKAGLIGSPVQFVASAEAGDPGRMLEVSGNGQLGFVNQPLADSFMVRVVDLTNNPIVGHNVDFSVESGNGLLNGTDSELTIQTDINGFASVNLTLGPDAGELNNVVHAAGTDGINPLQNSPIVFSASSKYTATKIVESDGNNQSAVVTSVLPKPLEVQVLDDTDTPVEGVPVTFEVNSGDGLLDNDTTEVTKITDSEGKASVTLTIGQSVGQDINVVHASADDGFDPLVGSPIVFLATGVASNATQIQLVGGNNQLGVAGEQLQENLEISVLDSLDNPVEGHPVVFEVKAGNGYFNTSGGNLLASDSVTVTSVNTDQNGIAEVSWVVGTVAGATNSVEASATDGVNPLQNSPFSFSATVTPGPSDPDSSSIEVTSPRTADGVSTATITVILVDKYKNPVSGKTVQVSSTGSLNTISQSQSPTNANGRAVATMTTFRAEVKTITATNTTDNITLNSNPQILFEPGEASRIVRTSGNDQTRNVGTFLKDPLVVTVSDFFDNPVPGVPVFFEVLSGNGFIQEAQPVITDENGEGKVIYALGDDPGAHFIQAGSGNLSGSPVVFSVNAVNNQAQQLLLISGNNQNGTSGEPLQDPLVVQILDANNNPVKDTPVTFSIVFGGGSVTPPQPAMSNANGIASTVFTLGAATGQHIAKAESPGLTNSPINFFANAMNAPAAKIIPVSGGGQSGSVLSSGSALIVQVLDEFDNPVSGTSVTFELINGGVTMTTPQPTTSDGNGFAQASFLHGTTSGVSLINATSVDLEGSPVPFEVTTVHGSASSMELFSGDEQIGTAGRPLLNPFEVIVYDQFRNPVSGYQITFVITQGDASIDGNQSKNVSTNANGISSVNLDLGATTGSIQVLAISSTGSLPGSPITFNANSVNNSLPTISVSLLQDTVSVDEDKNLAFNVSATDPENDPLQFMMDQNPEGATLTQSSANQYAFSWSPTHDQEGTYSIIFQVTDNKGGSDSKTVTIIVENVNRKPSITSFAPANSEPEVQQGHNKTFSVTAEDLDGQNLVYFWSRNEINVAAGPLYNYFAPPNFEGIETVVAYVTDGEDTVSVTWMVHVVLTHVQLELFTASVLQSGSIVELQWRTSSELDNLGFNIYRSNQRDGSYSQVNDELIETDPTGEYSYLDEDIVSGLRYYYKLEDIDLSGVKRLHGPVLAELTVPREFVLHQNFPNPFNPETTIRFQIPKDTHVTLSIINVLGQEVRKLVNQEKTAGFHSVIWDGRDRKGNLVTSGVYYFRIVAEEYSDLKKMIFMK